MTDQDIETLAALFHLGALDPDEERRLLEHTRSDEAAAKLLDSYATAATALGLSVEPVEPPTSLKESVMRAVATPRPGFETIPAGLEWQEHKIPGVQVKQLSSDDRTVTLLFKLAPNTVFPSHVHRGRELCYVVEGSYRTAGFQFNTGDFIRALPGTEDSEIRTEQGVTLLVVMSAEDFRAA